MEKMKIHGEAKSASLEGMLMVEQFLHDNYLFRRNLLSGKVEFAMMPAKGAEGDGLNGSAEGKPVFRPLTKEAQNSIIIRAMREEVCEKGSPKSVIDVLLHSEEVRAYDPIRDYLESLPKWDGQNHVAQLFSRLPGLSSEHLSYLTIWLRSVVVHWLQEDDLHGNECVPTLIGAQGCGKTTFFKRLLPPELRTYFLDHLNLSNKFDQEMALTNNLLVNIDELETIRPSQQASLKQTLSKSKVNGRPIFGSVQEDRPRYASFVSTTNNRHPLSDVTGSRRFICMTIPDGQYIDNDGEIDYQQLYAQVLYEIRELKSPHWFNNDEVDRIQELNMEYMGEKVKSLNSGQMIKLIQRDYPSVKNNHSTKVYLGLAMKDLGYEHSERGHVAYYKAIPLKAA